MFDAVKDNLNVTVTKVGQTDYIVQLCILAASVHMVGVLHSPTHYQSIAPQYSCVIGKEEHPADVHL